MTGAVEKRTPATSPPEAAARPRRRDDGGASIPATMWAAPRERYGPAELVTVREMAVPSPAPREVLIAVHAAGIDRGVWHLMTGLPYVMRMAGFGLRRPHQPVLGMDLAGRVVALGDDVTRLRVGDEVFGTGVGTFAEYAVAREDHLTSKPSAVPFIEAGAATVSGLAAWQAVHEIGRVRPGHTVLVLGASGGVGSFAVQLANALGAEVTGVASASKLDLVSSFGAVASSTIRPPTRATGPSDTTSSWTSGAAPPSRSCAVPSNTAGPSHRRRRERRPLDRRRRPPASCRDTVAVVPERLAMFISAPTPERLEGLRSALEGGITPAVDRAYGLDEVTDALQDLEAGRVRGKAVIRVRARADPRRRPSTRPITKRRRRTDAQCRH